MTQLDLQQKLEQAEHREQSAASAAVLLAEKVAEVKAERDALQQQVKDLQDKADFKQNLTEQVVALQQQVNALAAENLARKNEKPNFTLMQKALIAFYSDDEVPEMQMLMAFNILRNGIKTPATDAIKRQLMAEGVEQAAEKAPWLYGDQLGRSVEAIPKEQLLKWAAQLRQPEEKGHE